MAVNIFVIGSGNIGSRHVQSLASLSSKLNIFVIDPNKENLDKTKKLFFDQKFANRNNINIFFNQTIKKIQDTIDLAFISTNSDVRRKVIQELISKNNVKNIIIEKVAFQKVKDFKHIINLLRKKNIRSYVNFPRRAYQSYQKLKKELFKENFFFISHRINHNFASNILHILDLFSFLTNTKKVFVKDYNLNKTIYKSTRKGFIELKGSFKFYTNRGDILYCTGINDDNKKIIFGDHVRNKPNRQIKIETKNSTYTIFEGYQKILKTYYKKKIFYKTKLFKIPLQSKLTNVIVDELLKKNTIALPRLEETYDNHKMIIKIFSKHLRKYSKNISGCPIT